MMRQLSMGLLVGALGLGIGCGSGARSPNPDVPPYEGPEPVGPSSPGGPGGGFSSGPIILPPRPAGTAALIVDRLLLRAGPQGLALLDVSNPAAPVLAGRLALGATAILAAPTRDRVALTVTQKARYAGDQVPAAPLPELEQYLKLFDVTDPHDPLERASARLPFGTLAVVPLPAGYAVLGTTFSGVSCYGPDGGVVATQPEPPRPVFIERYGERAGAFVSEARQEYEMGAFELSTDGKHVVRFATDAWGLYAADVAVEVIDLTTLGSQTPLSVSKPPGSGRLSADVAGGVLLVAAGSQVRAVELSSGDVSAPLGANGSIDNVRFVVPGQLGALLGAGNDLVRLGRAGAALTLSLAPLPDGGTPLVTLTGALTPFGAGFLQLGGSGTSPEAARVIAKRYTFGDAGLAFLDEAKTDWPYTCCQRFAVDAGSQRVAYSVGAGPIGLLANVGGTFAASALSALGARVEDDGSFLFDHETLFVNHESSVEPVAIDLTGTRPALQAAPEVLTAPAVVLDRLEHDGLVLTLESQDNGEPSFGYRTQSSARVTLGVPHAAETMVALDAAHVAVLGLGHSGDCERLAELGTNVSGCGVYPHNGVSVFAIQGDSVELVRSLPLNQQALLQPALAGVEQTLDWSGFFQDKGGRFELLGIWKRHCTSEAACRAISTVAYHGTLGTAPSSMCVANCVPTVTKTVDGYRNESVLLALDFSNPDDPGLGKLALGGKAQDIIRPYRYDVGPYLLGYQATDGEHLAYASLEPVYDPRGSQVSDSHAQPLSRQYITLLESRAGELVFGANVNVPGTPIALFGSELTRKQAGQALFTLESSYRPNGSPYQTLDRVRIEAGLAYVEERLDVGPFAWARSVSPGLFALLAVPADACSEDAHYELRLADARSSTLALSEPVVLPLSGERWEHAGHGYSLGTQLSAVAPEGQVYVYGGPATNGRLVLDTTYNPPKVLRYETLE